MTRRATGIGLAAALALLAALTPLAATAAPKGTDFARMPVGCIRHINVEEKGRKSYRIDVFAGRQGKDFQVITYSGDQGSGTFGAADIFSKTFYDRDGLIKRVEFADGNVMTLRPRECPRTGGPCTYSEQNTKRPFRNFAARTARRGNRLYFSDVVIDGWEESGFEVTLGPFNDIRSTNRAGNRIEVFRYENCGI